MSRTEPTIIDNLTDRQREVLDATLALLIEDPAATTMIAVARKASCSKETLYKWFGDRDGLMAATVAYHASNVKVSSYEGTELTAEKFHTVLQGFASDLLTVLTGPLSVALNRLAIAQAQQNSQSGAHLGRIVLQNGRFSTGPRLKPALEAGMKAGLLRQANSEEVFRTFYGLIVRDIQIRLLLGDELPYRKTDIAAEAEQATLQFFTLYGPGGPTH